MCDLNPRADRPGWLLVLQWVDRVPWGVWWQGARSGAPGNVRSGGLRPGGQSVWSSEGLKLFRSVEATDLKGVEGPAEEVKKMLGNGVMKEEDLPRLPLYLSASSLVGHWVTCRAVAEQGTPTTRSVWQWGGGWGARLSWCMAEAMNTTRPLWRMARIPKYVSLVWVRTTLRLHRVSLTRRVRKRGHSSLTNKRTLPSEVER